MKSKQSIKKRLVEMFERVNKIKLDEMLNYAHVDSAEPTKDKFMIGMEQPVKENPILNQNSIEKRVYELRKGDVLSGSGAIIISDPVAGLNTPTGKVEIGVQYPDGKRSLKLWGKYTTVGVKSKA